MPRWALFLPFALMVALTALIGWRQGWLVANVTETEVIEATAATYVQMRREAGTDADAQWSDCRARPDPTGTSWLVVVCGPEPYDPARHYTFYVSRFGGIERVVGPEARE
ncbi:hypothetical protein SAMN05421759_102475 [Roseivivax lentus]|uniref:Uncharacterized protein n=1 Tax=Roseivivax lentus TaxID=633194 RepID=A0A1N7L8K5_9RHOB|nr:hypothetical protein [Roseivivax lentus]SIS70174.1 hypothetical protein SAMN05421759_102475 [Roseivivax lentus]